MELTGAGLGKGSMTGMARGVWGAYGLLREGGYTKVSRGNMVGIRGWVGGRCKLGDLSGGFARQTCGRETRQITNDTFEHRID